MAFPFVIGNVEIGGGSLVKGFGCETSGFGLAGTLRG